VEEIECFKRKLFANQTRVSVIFSQTNALACPISVGASQRLRLRSFWLIPLILVVAAFTFIFHWHPVAA
jgi:hypothetical protein